MSTFSSYTDGPRDSAFERHVAGTYTLFYRHGSPLSNFHPCRFEDEYGRVYSCSEQYYQHKKALDYGDHAVATAIARATAPGYMKRLGRTVDRFAEDRREWLERDAEIVMRNALRLKFSQNQHLAEHLTNRTHRIIAEASPTDAYWGIGVGMYSPEAATPVGWRGSNVMGKLLMELKEL